MAALDIGRLVSAVADTIAAHADELTALDQAIGDGDHGLNMKRGFDAVRGELAAIAAKPLPDALKAIGTKLVMTVGGASGPLFGTLLPDARQGTAARAGSRRARRRLRQGRRRSRRARQIAGRPKDHARRALSRRRGACRRQVG